MRLTEGASRRLEEYLAEVRGALAASTGVDADDVAAGIREHVEAELSSSTRDPVSAEDVAEVLEQLGSPSRWVETESPFVESRRAGSTGTRWPALVALGAVGAGGIFILTGVGPLWSVGWGLLVVGAIMARLAIASPDSGDPRFRRMVLLIWWVATLSAAVALLLGPAAIVWGAAQTGGFLEPWLVDWMGTTTRPRPARYWAATALIAGAASGVWWMLLGGIASRTHRTLRRALGPVSPVVPAHPGRGLALAGLALLVLSVVGGLLT